MTHSYDCVLSSKLISLPPYKPIGNATYSNSSMFNKNIKFGTLLKWRPKAFPKAGSASISCPPIDVDYLKSEFSGHGVSFAGISDSCVVRMALENGSIATLMLPTGLITSYKAPMWHGGLMELLHTTVSKDEESGDVVIQGGMSLDLNAKTDDGVSWSPNSWILHQVKGAPQERIQIHLISRDPEGLIEVRYIITLQQDLLSSEFIISSLSPSSLYFMGSIISHLCVSTPEATYAVGLEGSDFFSRSPVETNFSIVPSDYGKKIMKPQGPMALLSNWGASEQTGIRLPEALDGEEEDNYKHLAQEMSKIYTNAPQSFTVIDRGRRNSIVVGGEGFNELYMFSPGSNHKSFSKYSFVSIGHTALLEPIVLNSQNRWRGQQQLCNPNM